MYRDALGIARHRLASIALSPFELIACGFTGNVDRVVTMTDDLLDSLIDGRRLDLAGPRRARVDTVDELLTALLPWIASGEGVVGLGDSITAGLLAML